MKYRNLIIVLVCVVLANVLAHVWTCRWDLTDDRHYSLSEASKTLLRQTDAPIEVTLLLDGDLNAGFRRLKKATEEMIEELGVFAQITNHKSQITNGKLSLETFSSSLSIFIASSYPRSHLRPVATLLPAASTWLKQYSNTESSKADGLASNASSAAIPGVAPATIPYPKSKI